MGDSSTSVLLVEVSQWWSWAEHTQRWHRHLEDLWDLGVPWDQGDLHVPVHPASLAAHGKLCRDVHADLWLSQKCCLVLRLLGLPTQLTNTTFWHEHLQRKMISSWIHWIIRIVNCVTIRSLVSCEARRAITLGSFITLLSSVTWKPDIHIQWYLSRTKAHRANAITQIKPMTWMLIKHHMCFLRPLHLPYFLKHLQNIV